MTTSEIVAAASYKLAGGDLVRCPHCDKLVPAELDFVWGACRACHTTFQQWQKTTYGWEVVSEGSTESR